MNLCDGKWTNQLVRSNCGLGVLLRDTLTRPGCDRNGDPPTARQLLLPPEPYRPIMLHTIYVDRLHNTFTKQYV